MFKLTTTEKEIKIENCYNCPFENGMYRCTIDNKERVLTGDKPPNDCPLRGITVIMRLTQDNNE